MKYLQKGNIKMAEGGSFDSWGMGLWYSFVKKKDSSPNK